MFKLKKAFDEEFTILKCLINRSMYTLNNNEHADRSEEQKVYDQVLKAIKNLEAIEGIEDYNLIKFKRAIRKLNSFRIGLNAFIGKHNMSKIEHNTCVRFFKELNYSYTLTDGTLVYMCTIGVQRMFSIYTSVVELEKNVMSTLDKKR